MFGTLGGPELFLILVVALIVFGPRKLPEIGKSLGRMMGEFRRASNEFRRTIEDEVEAEKLREATRIDSPAWSSGPSSPAALPPAPSDQAGSPPAGPASGGPEPAPVSAEAQADAPPPDPTPSATVSRGELPAEPK
jgi:sec-independent protein translocase protein TatB